MIHAAIHMAVNVLRWETDKSGVPLIHHSLRVMLKGETEEEQLVGVLHDVVEAIDWMIVDIRNEFGDKIADAVDAISRRKDESYADYIVRVRTNDLATAVKLHDLEDNLAPSRMALLDSKQATSLRKRYSAAVTELSGK